MSVGMWCYIAGGVCGVHVCELMHGRMPVVHKEVIECMQQGSGRVHTHGCVFAPYGWLLLSMYACILLFCVCVCVFHGPWLNCAWKVQQAFVFVQGRKWSPCWSMIMV